MKPKFEAPLHVAWEITRRCNAFCVHCCSQSGPEIEDSQEVSTADAHRIIDELSEAGVLVLAFSGGEPLLRPDLPDLIEHATKRGMATSLCTNGALVDDDMARKLHEASLSSVAVSLDGACADTHDRIRHYPDLFDRALTAIRTLIAHGHRVIVSFTPTLSNSEETTDVVHLAYALGADSVCVSQYIPTGRGPRELMLNPGQLAELAREVSRLQAHYAKRLRVHFHDCHAALLVPPEAQQEYKGCGAGTGTAGIRVNGAVTPCVFMPNEVGNLCESSFAEIWDNAPDLIAIRDRDRLKTGNCGACKFKLVCGGCRAAAMAIHGNPLAGDPSCWLFPETPAPEEVASVSAR